VRDCSGGNSRRFRRETVKAFVASKKRYERRVSKGEIIGLCKEKMAAYKYPRKLKLVKEVYEPATGEFSRKTFRNK
jgi:long-chain acyl-CoA synthetase